MWKKVAIGVGAFVGALVVVLLIAILTRPSTYRVERSVTVGASPEAVYAQVTDFKKWAVWSPWGKLDPKMKTTFEGTPGAVGSVYTWNGNDDVGSGKMTIAALDPNKRVDIKLEFYKPFASTAGNGFLIVPAGKETKVTWFMDGNNDFMGKAFSLFMDMDKMIGADFEKGLGDMKKIVEATPSAAAM